MTTAESELKSEPTIFKPAVTMKALVYRTSGHDTGRPIWEDKPYGRFRRRGPHLIRSVIKMRDPKAIQELETQLFRDRAILADLRKREADLLQQVSGKGFSSEAKRNHLLCEMQVLRNSIAKNEQMLAMARR
jgi:hypothetical protein